MRATRPPRRLAAARSVGSRRLGSQRPGAQRPGAQRLAAPSRVGSRRLCARRLGERRLGARLFGALLLGALLLAAPAAAQPVERVPLDGARVEGEVVLAGTVTSTLDGVEMDALFDRVGGVPGARLVPLPPDAELLALDPVAHRYRVRFPAPTRLRVDLTGLAHRFLRPRGDIEPTLVGRLEVERAAPARAAASPGRAPEPTPPWGPLAVGALAALLSALLLRRRARPEARALARLRRAAKTLAGEARRLGPVYEATALHAEALVREGRAARARAHEARRGLRRTRGLAVDRALLEERLLEAIHRIDALADAAARASIALAARVAEGDALGAPEDPARALQDELRLLREAEREAAHLP